MSKRKTSMNRIQARQAEKKIMPAIKLLSEFMGNSRTDIPEKVLYGYHVVAGDFVAKNGESYQLQVKAVRAKKHFIKEQGVAPIFAKWAIGVKVRIYLTGLINAIFKG